VLFYLLIKNTESQLFFLLAITWEMQLLFALKEFRKGWLPWFVGF